MDTFTYECVSYGRLTTGIMTHLKFEYKIKDFGKTLKEV